MYNITTTNELKVIAEVNAMNTHAENALGQFQSFTKQAYDSFWFGETSPREKIKLLGTDAIKVFTDSAEAQGFIASKIEGYIPLGVPMGYEVNFNEDGSGVITGELLTEEII
jgi:S-formylglutathione hydrolase FrmB